MWLQKSTDKNLGIRIWECPKCHAVHDRDTNASINILKKDCRCSLHKDKNCTVGHTGTV
ncbi:MAG: zinc ribbon domain-containing protein [Blautia massiliensis (ex Durand et al. 2017)]